MQRSLFDPLDRAAAKGPSNSEIAEAKQRHPGMVLLFQVGTRYLLFDEDAIMAVKLLGLALMGRKSRPIAELPSESLEQCLRKLLQAGLRVAVCEQVEDKHEVH